MSKPTPLTPSASLSIPTPRSSTPQTPTKDHELSFRHRLSQREYPADCPPLNVRWYYAVDVPKRKPFTSSPPAKPPAKYVPFGQRDSRAIEAAFVKLSEEEEKVEAGKYKRASRVEGWSEEEIAMAGRISGAGDGLGKEKERKVTVAVNEDYLFDVDIKNFELSPVYWEGPVYQVRRGTWFYQEGSAIRPCEENLATQVEEGYLSIKPFRESKEKDTLKVPDGEGRPQSAQGQTPGQPQEWRLFGQYMGSFCVFVDPNTAWLFTDDLYGKLTAGLWQKLSAGTHLGGTKIVRGYSEPKKEKKAVSRPATPPAGEKIDEKYKRKSAPPPPTSAPDEAPDARRASKDAGRIALERKMSTYVDEDAQEKMMESEMKEDYRDDEDTDDPARPVEHLLLVTHGIGQKLSMKMESVSFVHDVNVFRKSLKSIYGFSPDLQMLNGESEDGKRKNNRIQCLPVCWRHLLDFPKQSLRRNRGERDIGSKEEEEELEEYPSLEDITVEGAPYVRNLMTDLALDVLLYQSTTYREHIIRTVLSECNRIYKIYKERNPDFKGKVSFVGHSLGSAIMFDILSRQPYDDLQTQKHELPRLDFPVENFFCLGSPVGLFQMLKGRTIRARTPSVESAISPLQELTQSPFDNSSTADQQIQISSPKVSQLYNIFHPADPIAYRMEPLVSKSLAQLKPQPLPYMKRGLFSPNGQIVGGISGIGQSVTKSMSSMWSSLSSGIANSILNRSLGVTDMGSAAPTPATIHSKQPIYPVEGQHPPTMLDAEIETLYSGFRMRHESDKPEHEEGRVRREEEKVRALNGNGRIDYNIQESVFDISVIASIASHLSYWGDEDVGHFIVGQLLSRSRVLRRTESVKGEAGDIGDGWRIDEFK